MKITLEQFKKFLVPPELVTISDIMIESVAEHGVIVPVVVQNGLLIDGHRRVKAAIKAKMTEIPAVESSGNPFLLYSQLNQQRQLKPLESAFLVSTIDSEALKKDFCARFKISTSPQMLDILKHIEKTHSIVDAEKIDAIPLNIWREFGHVDFKPLFKWFVNIEGTVSEKRKLAVLLRQCFRRQAFSIDTNELQAKEIIKNLKKIAEPRRTRIFENFARAIKNAQLPSGCSIEIDETLNRPGMTFHLQITRKNLDNFNKAADAAKKIFSEIQEI
jgi:hypothetical protein